MKKLVATLMIGIVFTSHAMSVNAATEGLYVGKIATYQDSSQETAASLQASTYASSKTTLKYKANLSVKAALVYGTTLYLSSSSTNKKTGSAVSIDKMTINGKITGKDKQCKTGSKSKKNTSSLSYELYTSDYGQGTLKQCTGTHKFENKGFPTKTLTTKKTYN